MRERKRLRKVQNKPGKIVEPSCAAPTGTGKLGPIEYQALSERLVTLRELADRCGVSKQAVSKWARKYNEKSKGSVCNATNGASTRGGREDGPVSNRVISFTDEDAETLAKSAAFSAVLASARCLDDNSIGPSGVKAAVAALADAVALVERFGVVPPPSQSDEDIPELVVRVMTLEEAEAIRAAADEETSA